MPAGQTIRGLLVELVLAVVAALFAVTAFGFGVAAGYLALSERVGRAAAAGWVALGLLILAAVLAGVIATLSARRARRAAQARLAAREAAMAPLNQLAGVVSASPAKSLLVAAVAGILAGWLDRRL
ncbi:MAG TPA: hypothetical protein PKA13_02160 [Geminicoccaceae bacterium]|nr:hypothetical protein [Geminicoccus sp.]HMU48548.1 hypothetical protein [Geminicoccaceae bacterium]